MRKFKLILLFSIYTLNGIYGQISTTKNITIEEVKSNNLPYDGTINFLGSDVAKYVGQELYLKGKKQMFQKYGYDCFYINYKKSSISYSNIYKSDENLKSKYSELAGKYFKVLEVIKHPDAEKYKNTELSDLYSKKYFLKLEQKETKDIVYFEYDSEISTSFPFIVVNYFENLKISYIGKEYILREKWSSKTKDIKTGNIVSKLGDKWKCVDLTIEEENFELSLILENINGEQIIAELYLISNIHFCFTKEKADYYEAKFGSNIWNTILESKVVIGMTSEMCKLSWGNPKSINETLNSGSKDEQWVYDDNYLYFENGLLKTIQSEKK
jgi:hypothetical protein